MARAGLTKVALLAVPLIVFGAGPATPAPSDDLLDNFTGHWVLQGVIDGKQTVHDVEAKWVLKHEYLQIHEVSRERATDGEPAYEAIVTIGRDPKTGTYACLWLDNTAGGGLKGATIAHGERTGDEIPFLFELGGGSRLHTTFSYLRASGHWRWTIDDEENGKTTRFADVMLSRR